MTTTQIQSKYFGCSQHHITYNVNVYGVLGSLHDLMLTSKRNLSKNLGSIRLRAMWQKDGHVNFWSLVSIPSASSKIFWPCSKLFDHFQYFLIVFKYFWPCSNMQVYKVQSYFWPSLNNWLCSKNIERGQIFWTQLKYFWASRWNKHCSAKYQLSAHIKFPKYVIFSKLQTIRHKAQSQVIFDYFSAYKISMRFTNFPFWRHVLMSLSWGNFIKVKKKSYCLTVKRNNFSVLLKNSCYGKVNQRFPS